MNINVVTWGRLMKRALPQQCADNAGVLSPASQIGSPGECLYYVCDDTQQPHRWCNG
jgi:protein kinase N